MRSGVSREFAISILMVRVAARVHHYFDRPVVAWH
jgi:hypothetical protein